MPDQLHQLLTQITSSDTAQQTAAREALLLLQEDAVNPLLEEFYAGVHDALGVAILEIVAEIGGPDALSMLRNVFYFEGRPAWKQAAARGLHYNQNNLDAKEIAEVQEYLNTG